MGYLILKPSFRRVAVIYNLQLNKRVRTFPKCINPKVNVIAEIEFELAFYNDVTNQHVSHKGMETPLENNKKG